MLEAFQVLLPMMTLMEEARNKGGPMRLGAPVVRCKAFKDNLGALKWARLPKIQPHTHHINVKYHHFWEAVAKGPIKVQHVILREQLGNALTKNLPQDLFVTLREKYMGWWIHWPLLVS
jgi:hypothetical protein